MDYPDMREVSKIVGFDLKERLGEIAHEYGLQNYINRLDNLLLTGDKVLDAGCGSGAWTIALSFHYQEVVGRDISRDGLCVLKAVSELMNIENIQIDEGSIEDLPYERNYFDTILCYGVIFFCDLPKVMNEFFKVLKPGGKVYLTLNDIGWYQWYTTVPRRANYGKINLYNTFWKRYLGLPVRHPNGPDTKEELYSSVSRYCGNDWIDRLDDDYDFFLAKKPLSVTNYNFRSYSFDEINKIVQNSGFVGFTSSTEGGLVLNTRNPAKVAPRFIGCYEGNFASWECMFMKPRYQEVVNV